jgi:hypothetical protein
MFATHPAWIEAARRIQRGAQSRVFFSHLPGEVWHLARTAEGSRLEPGPGSDPDFVFRFSPGAIARLARVEGGVGDFAAELFDRILSDEASTRVDLRIVAPFHRLARRGYLGLVWHAASRLVALGAAHGVQSLRDLRRLVEEVRKAPPEAWEREEGQDQPGGDPNS